MQHEFDSFNVQVQNACNGYYVSKSAIERY